MNTCSDCGKEFTHKGFFCRECLARKLNKSIHECAISTAKQIRDGVEEMRGKILFDEMHRNIDN